MISKISGWGLCQFSETNLLPYSRQLSLRKESNPRGYIPRGLGRSYGDSALNSGGTTLETNLLKDISIDPESGIAVIGAGVTIQTLEEESLKVGYFPYVVPGTAQVTIGGAIASDIHGKSHHRVGSFSSHLLQIRLMNSVGVEMDLRPDDKTSEIFWSTVGGMGLTGLILQAKIQLSKVESRYVLVEERRAKDLDELMGILKSFNERYLYTVAWVDLSGKFLGRGLVSGAKHAGLKDLPKKNRKVSPRRQALKLPSILRIRLINTFTIRIFNLVWFYKPIGKQVQDVEKYMHPLDGVENWNILYGKAGFIQYQFVVPLGREDVLREVLLKIKSSGNSSFLTVLKSFGEDSNGFIAFPIKGWTLAIDFPIRSKGLSEILSEIDEMVVQSGGRIYLTKDSRLSSIDFAHMYPNFQRWKEVKYQVDPINLWQSDQGRRLRLC